MWISTVSTTFRLKKEKIKRFQLVAATGFVYDSFMDSKASFCNLFFLHHEDQYSEYISKVYGSLPFYLHFKYCPVWEPLKLRAEEDFNFMLGL